MKIKYKISLFLAFVVLGVMGRFAPHLWNMTPVGSLAFLAGAQLGLGWGLALPFFTMLISDSFFGFYSFPMMASVYIFIVVYGVFGYLSRKNKNFALTLSGVGVSSILFFVFTNMAVWNWGTMYLHNFGGLMTSYLMALPFFFNQILGDLFFTSSLFLLWEMSALALVRMKSRQLKEVRG